MANQSTHTSLKGIAIVGMAGHFPGAKSIDQFWQNLCDGVESISFFTDDELSASNVELTLLNDPDYVKAGAVLADIEMFDARFFGFPPREAEVMDPQHRLFLECAWKALENAGYASEVGKGLTGVYAGSNFSTYLHNNLISNHNLIKSLGVELTTISNDKDYIPTRVSHKLNLRGPSLNISTACSTSLVAVHLGCRGLLSYECDLALAGGISIQVPQKAGYLYQQGGIASPDGHCRAFDAKAQGTIFGSGVGIVVLKRLKDALADGDCIHAVIKGSAINNDGSLKVGYTAPSVDGQAEVIAESQAIAGFNPETITYIETHGTGTALGDPIEIRALKHVFRASTQKKGFCGIGSVKTNIGHLNSAAGVTGLIKTILALKYKMIPPSLHFENPNPEIDFANSPFYVNTELSPWNTNGTPRRAGVSSFGIGGTNAHVVLEEAPIVEPSGTSRPYQLLLLSAKTGSALETATANLAHYLHSELNLADTAYTLSLGRKAFNHRRILVCQDIEDAKNSLSILDPKQVLTQFQEPKERAVIFMFSGQGAQYVNMAQELYQNEPTFAEQVDRCCNLLQPHLESDLRQILYPSEEHTQTASEQLQQTAITQPALFVIEYALAQLWMEWGVHPTTMMGHSIGEYVAATLAGVFSLEDALAVVVARGKLMQELPSGSMLAVPLSEADVRSLLGNDLSLAAVNGSSSCIVSGPTEAVKALENHLASQDVDCRYLHTSHAFHSPMMEPILDTFTQRVEQVNLKPPQIPYISNVSGTWITSEDATSPSYWATHLRQTVRFSAGLQEVLQKPAQVLLEIGPGRTLTTLAKRHPNKKAEQVILSSLRHPKEVGSDVEFALKALGQLWLAGVDVNWSGFYAHEQRHRLPLPTYPFERQRYWIDPPQLRDNNHITPVSLSKKSDVADWFYIPCWKQSVPLISIQSEELTSQVSCTLVFIDECGLGSQLLDKLKAQKQDVITVKVGTEFAQLNENLYTLNPGQCKDYDTLLNKLLAQQKLPTTIAHLWSVTPPEQAELDRARVDKAQETGFYSLVYLAQALGKLTLTQPLQMTVISNNMQSVTGEESLSPEKATLLGPVKVISQEYQTISCRSIDVILPSAGSWQLKNLVDQLLLELKTPSSDQVIAYRGNNRWLQTFTPIRLDESLEETPRLREEGVYLITGGLGGIGLVLAEHLAKTVRAKLILTGRSAFPGREEWDSWLVQHEATDNISRKIHKVRELEELGAEVLVIRADVSDLTQMTDTIRKVKHQFGQINGVIHAAGIIEGKTFNTIEQISKAECNQQFQSKVHGLLVLEKVLQNQELDFCLLMSSLSSILGGLEYVAYTAANLFMDVFTYHHNRRKPSAWCSVNWDTWQINERYKRTIYLGSTVAEFSMKSDEGVNIFRRILGHGNFEQIVVSTGNLLSRLNQWPLRAKDLEDIATSKNISLHPRPELEISYVAPRHEIEKNLTDIWQNLLGIKQIGIHDNFFELGGDSLLATQVISRVYKTLHIELPINTMFETPTIAEISKYMETTYFNALDKREEEVL